MTQRLIRVAIAVPLNRLFDYLLPDDLAMPAIGARVRVPFGRRKLIGIVIAVPSRAEVAEHKLKAILDVIDDESLFADDVTQLIHFASDYYCHSLGEVYAAAMPKWLRDGRYLADIRQKIKPESNAMATALALELNPEQAAALAAISKQQHFATLVLDGVTGSGKTEVYLQAIAEVLARQQTALVLVPEISLTPQTVARFQARFAETIVTLHSRLSDGARAREWVKVHDGCARIVIGTRSAVFAPIAHLGLIIIDEEHDASFQQQSGFRYHARALAITRAKLCDCPIVLGSATPSLKTLVNVEKQRFSHLVLTQRATQQVMPECKLYNICGQQLQAGLSDYALTLMSEHLAKQQQVMVFINRRGYAPVLMCHHCGYAIDCPHCARHMTWHDRVARVMCHHCGYRAHAPRICPGCKQAELAPLGVGTEQLEHFLNERFPDAVVARVDRDTTKGKDALTEVLAKVNANEVNILLGTQMLAKGHHFAELTLVVVLDIDQGLYSAELDAMESLGQLLLQVAGRAGRAQKQGQVLIQTHQSQHPLLQLLLSSGYGTFAQALLQQRQETGLPPYTHMAKVVAEAKQQQDAVQLLQQLQQQLNSTKLPSVQRVGPMPASMEKRASWYGVELLLLSDSRANLHQCLQHCQKLLSQNKPTTKLRWHLLMDC